MRENWLKDSGYSRKIALFFGLIVVGIALFLSFVATINESDPNPWLAAAFTAVGGIAICSLFASIRCRTCGGRVAWWVARHAPAGRWLSDLMTLSVCPICGSGGGSSKAAETDQSPS